MLGKRLGTREIRRVKAAGLDGGPGWMLGGRYEVEMKLKLVGNVLMVGESEKGVVEGELVVLVWMPGRMRCGVAVWLALVGFWKGWNEFKV